MRIVLDAGADQREVAVAVDGPDVTVAEVLAAAGCPPVDVVHVEGRRVPSEHTVAEAAIPDGATVHLVPPPGRSAVPVGPPPPHVTVVTGADAGSAVVLDRAVVVGRDRGCDLVVQSETVAGRHCRIVRDGRGRVTVTDLGTAGGTWAGGGVADRGTTTVDVGAVVRIGAVVLRIEAAAGDDRPHGLDPVRHLGPGGAVPFNRPPRPGVPPPVPAVQAPAPPPPVREAPPFNVAALLAPVVLGAVMVVVLGSWRYAAFMALSPLLLLANTVSGRRRATREGRALDRARQQELEVFAAELASAAEAARRRRWELLPSLGEVLRRAVQPSTRLWERRLDDADALQLHLGVGAAPWEAPLTGLPPQGLTGPARAAVEQWSRLPRSPVGVDLSGGGVVGIVGDRARAVAVARSLLLQACVHHGPADLPVAVVAAPDHLDDWDWSTWLPHTLEPAGTRRLAAGDEESAALLAALRARADEDGTLLLVVDDPSLLRGRDADARAVLRGVGGPVAGMVLAASSDQLPAVCDTVVEVGGRDGPASLSRPAERSVVDGVLVAELSTTAARCAARRLAGLEDPDVRHAAAELPQRVDLVELLPDAFDVGAAWDRAADRNGLSTPIGVGPDGAVVVDLVKDGPHVLLGGTTGAGKSELLRSLVAGLAATHDPDHCTFVLVDYKGGAAFDACADLPHVVGVVTDLDEHLGRRALRCLEAELTHRERRLRSAGASDLAAWLRLPAAERGAPLPRLVVVVDEFATLRAELPDFVASLVGIAQRGRSLGVHLVLGTQRPSGAVDENVRANANLRIALRVTDERDALDLVGAGDAAAIPASSPGRGVLRTGPGVLVPVQTALVSGTSAAAGSRVRVGPVRFGRDDRPGVRATGSSDGPSDLARLVAACRAASERRGLAAPRTPWPAPLPATLTLDELPPAGDVPVPFGLLDDPEHQRRVTVGWDPRRGNLLVHGTVGSGTTSTLATVAVAAAREQTPDQLHLHVLDLGRGELVALAGLPHCGAVVTAREVERRARLQAWLLDEAERRRRLDHAALAAEPLHVLFVDGLASWLDELDDPAGYAAYEAVQRYLLDAPQLRMAVVATVPRHGAVRGAVSSATEQRLVHRLADPNDYAALGLRPADVPTLPPGRAVRPDGGLLQVALTTDVDAAVDAIAARHPVASSVPAPIASLPAAVAADALGGEVVIGGGAWRLPVGLDAVTLAPVSWDLHPGDHALVLGPPASGRSGLLRGLAELAGRHAATVAVGGDGQRWPAGVEVRAAAEVEAVLAEAALRDEPTLVLVDDAEHVPDPGAALEGLAAPGTDVRVVAAARLAAVQADYGHWLRRVARGRAGAFLRPTGDVPGDLLGVRIPRQPPLAVRAGRGWLAAGGAASYVQVLAGPS